MSMYPGHRGMGGVPPPANTMARLNELLDQIRSEFDSQMRHGETFEHQSKLYLPQTALFQESLLCRLQCQERRGPPIVQEVVLVVGVGVGIIVSRMLTSHVRQSKPKFRRCSLSARRSTPWSRLI